MDMKNSLLIKCAIVAAALPWLAGCVHREVVYRDRPVVVATPPPAAPVPAVAEEAPAPPPPQAEVVTVAPGPTAVWYWAPGAWEWRGRWVWSPGHWVARPHPGAVWISPHWDWRGHHRVWITGYWR